MLNNEQYEQSSDEELVQLSLENQAVFYFIMKRYEAKLLRYIVRITNVNYEDAEDVLQDVFLKVYRNLNGFDPSLKFSSWIYRIIRNEVISQHRKKQARAEGASFEVEPEVLERIAADLDIEAEVNRQFLRKAIIKILNNIDPKYREVLALRYFDEKDYREISDILKKPMGTIATLLNRAKKQFREKLKEANLRLT